MWINFKHRLINMDNVVSVSAYEDELAIKSIKGDKLISLCFEDSSSAVRALEEIARTVGAAKEISE